MDRRPYHFSIIRYRYSIVHGEFVNIGIVMLELDTQKIRFRLSREFKRIAGLFGGKVDRWSYDRMLNVVEENAQLAMTRKFNDHPLTLTKTIFDTIVTENSSALYRTDVMGGIIDSPERRFEELYYEFIESYEK